MTYKNFEDVPVWQEAIRLGRSVYEFTQCSPFKSQYSLRDQIERAAVSVSNNIAEGFERGTTQELITFLYYSRGSAGEVRSMLCLMEGLPGFGNLKSEISNLKSISESCSRQLRAWADSLQNSEIKGQRYLSESVRRRDASRKSAAAFQEKLIESLPENHPLRRKESQI
jgi:four helix bundle protein